MSVFYLSLFLLNYCVNMSEHSQEYYRQLPPVDYSLANAVKTDIIYKIFKNKSEDKGKLLDQDSIGNENLDRTIPTVLLIHGWTTDDTSPWFEPLKNAYFETGPHNIIYINWQKAGNLSYDVSSANIKPVGAFIAKFLVNAKIPPLKIHIVGHSLGSHLAGFIGKSIIQTTDKKIGRITALDPAGPKFENAISLDFRLSKDDAKFVDVIHTDIQRYGYTHPIGHVDFYPNDGKHQPGCPPRDIDGDANCSHARSTLYFIESLKTIAYADKCLIEEVNDEINVKKLVSGKVIFGQNVDKSARGSYCFNTNSEKPFLCT